MQKKVVGGVFFIKNEGTGVILLRYSEMAGTSKVPAIYHQV